MESSAIDEAEAQQDNDVNNTATSSTTPNDPPRRARSNSVIDSLGYNKYLTVLSNTNVRRRSKSFSTAEYYNETSTERQCTNNLRIARISQSNEMVESDTIDALTIPKEILEEIPKEINNAQGKTISNENSTKKEAQESPKSSPSITALMPVPRNADCYNMNHKNRGKCIIFNHTIFEMGTESRKGTEKDVERLEKTFGSLGFDVELYNDFTYTEIKDKVEKVSKLDHTDNDCLCIITLTHGANKDLLFAKDAIYTSDQLWKPFTADKCLTLAGKPKLFFIQACRGNEIDDGVVLTARSLIQEEQTETDSNASYAIPTHADFLLAHSSAQGFYTWRSPTEGTWYIQCLCDILDEYGITMDLMSMLTLTARKVATEFSSSNTQYKNLDNKKQVPSVTTMLIRSVYFPPKSKIE